MNADALRSYYNDHLAGATVALNILRRLHEADDEPSTVKELAAELLPKIKEDKHVLEELLKNIRANQSVLKQLMAWIAAKFSWLKLGRKPAGRLGTFESLEVLSLGILGKRALWRMLSELHKVEKGFEGVDFDRLIDAAESQYDRVEDQRIAIGLVTFR